MTKAHTSSKLRNTVIGAFMLAMVSTSFSVLVPSAVSPAFASGCGGQGDFGCDTGTAPAPGNNSPGGSTGSNPSPAPPSTGGGGNTGGGGGNSAPADPNTRVTRIYDAGRCDVRGDGKAAIARDVYTHKIYGYGPDEETSPPGGYAWEYQGYSPGYGYSYTAWKSGRTECLYPPRTYFTDETCFISSTAVVDRVRPTKARLASKTTSSGYSYGSTDYNACVNSHSRAGVGVSIDDYGYYRSNAYSRAVIAKVEISITPNEVTGVTPGPKIVALSAPFITAPKAATASLDCNRGFSTPGVLLTNYTEEDCSSQNSKNPSYRCVANPVLFNISNDPKKELLKSFNAQNSIQFMRDGVPRKTVFGQSITGSSIKVNSYTTQFFRDKNSSPWDTRNGAVYGWKGNIFQMRTSADGKSIFPEGAGTKSKVLKGKVNDTWTLANTASNPGQPTIVTQKVQWTGTRTIQSARITEVNGETGKISWVPTTVVVPTTGSCSQTASMEYVRAIGDVVIK